MNKDQQALVAKAQMILKLTECYDLASKNAEALPSFCAYTINLKMKAEKSFQRQLKKMKKNNIDFPKDFMFNLAHG